MAKAAKKAKEIAIIPSEDTSKTEKKKAAGNLAKEALVAVAADAPTPAEVSATFKSGIGQITASLFRKGILINMQSISTSGSIHFSDVQSGDAISVNGICTGTASVGVNVPTDPVTPQDFTAGNINTGYDVV